MKSKVCNYTRKLLFIAGKDVHRECRRNGGNGTLHSETENSFFEINDEVSLDHPAKRRKTSCSEPHCNYEPSNFLGSRIPISGDYVPITFPDGRRRYLRVESEVDDGSVVDSSTSGLNSYKSLLPYDLCRLVQNAENLVCFVLYCLGGVLSFRVRINVV